MSSTLSNIGVLPCPHAPCLYSGRPIAGEPPLYLALYVDDFVYFSASDSVERAFEYKLTQSLKVDFFGCATWFLGISFAWDTSDLPLHLSVHLNQSAFILHLLQIHDMMDCVPASSPFRSGLPIDRVPSSELTPAQQAHLNSVLQSFNGSFIWLSTCTRPDLSVITSQLCAYNHKASAGLLDAARYVLRYLKGSPHHGISFSSRHPTPLHTFINLPPNLTPSSEPSHHLITFSDANWGPQDASNPDPSLPVLLPVSDTRSISGYVSIRSGGPVQWGVTKQRRSARSSAESEIVAMDEATKATQALRLVLEDLSLADTSNPTPIYVDNQASIKWSHNCCFAIIVVLPFKVKFFRSNLVTPSPFTNGRNAFHIILSENQQISHILNYFF